jgi:hypothetical protein
MSDSLKTTVERSEAHDKPEASNGQREGCSLDGMVRLPPVLDVCCGSRMFWFDRKDSRALYPGQAASGGAPAKSLLCGVQWRCVNFARWGGEHIRPGTDGG